MAYLQNPITGGNQRDLSFFYFRGFHIFTFAKITENSRRIVFMDLAVFFFPYMEMFFSHRQ
jgi:hypothetical protein